MGRPVPASAFDPASCAAAPSPAEFRNGMARLAAAVSIVTTVGPAGRAGFTATSVCPVTDDPPTLLVCLNRSSSVHRHFVLDGPVCVNVLAASQEHVARRFSAGGPTEARFSGATWRLAPSGAAALPGALVTFDGRIRSIAPIGTHDIIVCEIGEVSVGSEEAALVYRARTYHAL